MSRYLDLGDRFLFVPDGIEQLRAQLLAAITPEIWLEAVSGFEDIELANQ